MTRAKRRRRKRRPELPTIALTTTIKDGPAPPFTDVHVDGYPMKGPDGKHGMGITISITGGDSDQSLPQFLRSCASYFDGRPQLLRDAIGQCLVANAVGNEKWRD